MKYVLLSNYFHPIHSRTFHFPQYSFDHEKDTCCRSITIYLMIQIRLELPVIIIFQYNFVQLHSMLHFHLQIIAEMMTNFQTETFICSYHDDWYTQSYLLPCTNRHQLANEM